MSNVEFEDKQTVYRSEKKRGITQMLIRFGIAKDEKSAQVVMLVIAGLAVVSALFLVFSSSTSGKVEVNQLPPEQTGI